MRVMLFPMPLLPRYLGVNDCTPSSWNRDLVPGKKSVSVLEGPGGGRASTLGNPNSLVTKCKVGI